MNRWYSPRGARRGLLAASLVLLVWLGWAIAYMQGLIQTSEKHGREGPSAPPRIDSQRCMCGTHA